MVGATGELLLAVMQLTAGSLEGLRGSPVGWFKIALLVAMIFLHASCRV
jgi:hypothetical protein